MADQKVSIIYTIKDKATTGLKKLYKSVFSLRNILIGGAGLAGAIVKVTSLFEKQRQVFAQTDQVLESTGHAAGLTAKEVNNLAKEMQKVTNFGDEVVQSGQNMLLTFTKIGKDVFPQATEIMLDLSVAMEQDIKQSAIQLGKALNDPIQGVTALRRVGVQLSKQQEEQIRSFMAVNDIASAQKIILGELATQVGGSARAVVSPYVQLKNALGDLGEAIGETLSPQLTEMSEKLTSFVQGNMPTIIESFKALLSIVKGVAQAFIWTGEKIGELVWKIVEFSEKTAGFFESFLEKFRFFKEKEKEINEEFDEADKMRRERVAKEKAEEEAKAEKEEKKRIKARNKQKKEEEKANDDKRKREEQAERVSQNVIQGILTEFQEGRIKSVGDFIKATGKIIKQSVMNEVMAHTMAGVARAFRDYPFPASLGVAAMAAAKGAVVLAAVQAIPFAQGGIVPGVNRGGDSVHTVLTPGEAVLNEEQQSNLLNIANGGAIEAYKSPDPNEAGMQHVIIVTGSGEQLTEAIYTKQQSMLQTGELS